MAFSSLADEDNMGHWKIARVTDLRDTSQAVREGVTFLHTTGHKKDTDHPRKNKPAPLFIKETYFPIDDSQES